MENRAQILSQRQALSKQYSSARANLMLAIVLTVANIVLFFSESGSMLLFSVSVPYFAVIFGYLFDITAVGLVFAAVILALYLLCWLLSKNKSGWMTAAAILFGVDTVLMAGLYFLMEDASGIMDAIFHIWILFYLISGASAGSKLKKLPVIQAEDIVGGDVSAEYSTPLRIADEEGKQKVYLQYQLGTHNVIYRRVHKIIELVIDGKVYDEYSGLPGLNHNLKATIGGRLYEVGYGNDSRVYFRVDGVEVESRKR